MARRPRFTNFDSQLLSYLEWRIDDYLQNPTKRNLAEAARDKETVEKLKQKEKRGKRGPKQFATEKYADGAYFTEISRFMEMHGSNPHRATASVVRDLVASGKLSTDKTKEESHVQRIYKKFLQQR